MDDRFMVLGIFFFKFKTMVQSYWYIFSVDHNLTLRGLLLCNQVLEANPSCYLWTPCCEQCQWVCCVNIQCVVTNLCTVFPCIFNTFSSYSMLLSSKQLPYSLIQWVKHACHCRKRSGNPVLWKLPAQSSILFGMPWGKQVPSLYVGICWQQKKVEWASILEVQTVFVNESVTKRKYQRKGNQFAVHHFSGNFHSTSSGTESWRYEYTCWLYVYICWRYVHTRWFTWHDSINVEHHHPKHQCLQYMTHHAELQKPYEWPLHDVFSQKRVLSMCRFPQQLCVVWKKTLNAYTCL